MQPATEASYSYEVVAKQILENAIKRDDPWRTVDVRCCQLESDRCFGYAEGSVHLMPHSKFGSEEGPGVMLGSLLLVMEELVMLVMEVKP